jgi:RNA polymerase sigma factor (sigma-70 family)
MPIALDAGIASAEENGRISETIQREGGRLRNFIRKRVADESDVEDILQDVFYELVEAYRLMKPVEQVGAWLFGVTRNRITDFFRRRKSEAIGETSSAEDGEFLEWADILPAPEDGPEAEYARQVLLEEIDAALDELPEEQRAVFIAHERDGRSFKEMAEETGLSVNTLLARKHYAVRQLRRHLREIYDDWVRA